MAINLASLQKNCTKTPRIIIYGPAGCGKTTFGACAPNSVFICTEDGLGNLDATSFPLATEFDSVMESIASLYTEDHKFETVVVDSLDWLENLIWKKVCVDHGIESVESLGYGRAYVEALSIWRRFYDGINALRDKGMTVIMICHGEIRTVNDPQYPSFDMHGLKLHKRAAALAEEFADVILFATIQTNTITEEKGGFDKKRTRAVSSGNRIMHTIGSPSHLAKNRYSLPSPLPLSWDALAEAMGVAPATQSEPTKPTKKGA